MPELTEAQQLELLQRLRSLSWVAQDLRKSGKDWLKKHADLLDIQAEQLAKAMRKFGIAAHTGAEASVPIGPAMLCGASGRENASPRAAMV